MIKNFIIGLSLIALGVIVVGSLDAARTAAPNLAIPNAGSLINEQRAVRQVGGSGCLRFHKWDERGCSRREC